MKTLRSMFAVCLVGALASFSAIAQASAAESCHKINAKGIGQDLGNGRTTADINGGGLLNGTTAGLFGISPTADPNVFDLVGSVVFTTNKATLTVAVSGTFDTGTGEFAASGPATAATGKLTGATGNLSLAGVEDLSTGRFTETVQGNICVDLAP
jgi:hypothetical protein